MVAALLRPSFNDDSGGVWQGAGTALLAVDRGDTGPR
jgi:hypothetical protein